MWSVAPKSIIQDSSKLFSEACNPKENGDLLERANEHAPKGFSSDPIRPLSFSISSLLKPSNLLSLWFTCSTKWAWYDWCYPHRPHSLAWTEWLPIQLPAMLLVVPWFLAISASQIVAIVPILVVSPCGFLHVHLPILHCSWFNFTHQGWSFRSLRLKHNTSFVFLSPNQGNCFLEWRQLLFAENLNPCLIKFRVESSKKVINPFLFNEPL